MMFTIAGVSNVGANSCLTLQACIFIIFFTINIISNDKYHIQMCVLVQNIEGSGINCYK